MGRPLAAAAPRAGLLLLAGLAGASAGPVPLVAVSGVDDQTMSDYCASAGGGQLGARYATLQHDLAPGMRRYNAFWSAAESSPPFPAGSPPAACPPGTMLVPDGGEPARVARGYRAYHCYSAPFVAAFDDYLALDAQIGAASAFIVYGSPPWARTAGCTGFPWGKDMYQEGCLPWGHLDAWFDYILFLTERWSAPWGSGKARLSHLVIWNEVQSMGWADPSPVLPNRWAGAPWSAAQLSLYTAMIANLTLLAGAAARVNSGEGMMLWLSTDHFTTAPPLQHGDVGHIGLYDLLPPMMELVGTGLDWGVAVHPYDAGDPRANLTAQGVYTFATLKEAVADVQCALLTKTGLPPSACASAPQTLMYASEQGWPFNAKTMNKTTQARNICLAHELSLAQAVYAVTHNFFQAPAPTSQGDAGDFSLLDYVLPVGPLFPNLTNGRGHATYDAYAALNPAVWGKSSAHYCCTAWGVGCA